MRKATSAEDKARKKRAHALPKESILTHPGAGSKATPTAAVATEAESKDRTKCREAAGEARAEV